MLNFERNKNVKEKLKLGNLTWVDYRFYDFLEANGEDLETPIIIYGLEITESINLKVVFEFVEKEKDLLIAEKYCWQLFRDLSLGHIFEKEDYELAIREAKTSSLVFRIKDIYKKSFSPGQRYEAI